jgi:hypothetical protein
MNLGLPGKSYRLIVAVLLAVTAFSRSFGQGKMLDGYIVSAKGDTVKGFIRYDGWGTSPMTIDFAREKNGEIEKVGPDVAVQFFLAPLHERYVSKRIGILNINLSKTYQIAPSFEAKDSVTVYLREVTSGPKASLMEYLDLTETTHFFVEKDRRLTELLYYSFYREVRGRKYLIQYDEYVRQLPMLLADETIDSHVRDYSAKALGQYVDRYNGLTDKVNQSRHASAESEMQIDAYIMGGMEGWEEEGVSLGTKPTFGAGLRIDLPRRFHNRYFKILFSTIRGVSESEVYNYTSKAKVNLNTLEIGIGTYIGSGNVRPNLGLEYSFPMDGWRSSIFGPHIGVSYKRQLSLEVSHFANFSSVLTNIMFFNRPRISLNYYMNLNKFFKSRK